MTPQKKSAGTAGYSGTPLAQKLGIEDGQLTWRWKMPAGVREEIERSAAAPDLVKTPRTGLAMAHVFVTERHELADQLRRLREVLAPAGVVWVSWPKKASGVATEITEDVVRDAALPLGFVDIKVCAVDAVWSGLKLVIRKTERAQVRERISRRKAGRGRRLA